MIISKTRDTIKIPAFTKNWRIVYDFLHQHLKNNKIEKKILSRVLLASEEIFVNISNYAYEGKNGDVVINFKCSNMSPIVIKIKFTDQGIKFDPTKVKKADVSLSPSERKIGGLGLFIVYKVMDKVEYEYTSSSNNLTITKIIKETNYRKGKKDMTFEKIQKKDEVTCIIEGRVDTQSSPDLQIEFEKILDENVKKYTLDFEKVDYLSSAGLRVILWLQKKVSAMENGAIQVINANDEVYEVFDMTGFTDFLPVNVE